MIGECVRCAKSIGDVYLICEECSEEMFSKNVFWINASPIISSPVIDRYKEDSEPVIGIGERPGDEIQYREGPSTLQEIKDFQHEDMDKEDYLRIEQRMNNILAELGVLKELDFDSYRFSKEDLRVFSEIFFTMEEVDLDFLGEKGESSLYVRMGNLFYYTTKNVDSSYFEPTFREEAMRNFYEEAESYYQLALDIDEENLHAHINGGDLSLYMEEYDQAKDHFEMALENGADQGIERDLIRAYIGAGDLQEAEDRLEDLLEDEPEDPEIWYLKGEIARKRDRWGGAIQFYNKATSNDDDYIDAYLKNGEVLLQKEMYSEADQIYDLLLQKDDDLLDAWFGKAQALLGQDKWGGAFQCLNETLSRDPQIKEGWKYMGDIYQERGEYQKALQSYDRALTIDENYTAAVKAKESCKEKL